MERPAQRPEVPALRPRKTSALKHQQECLARFGKMRAFALLAEMGTGKTWIVINNAADLWADNVCDAMLIFAPNGVQLNWVLKELPKHMPGWVRWKAAAWRSDARKEEREALEELLQPLPDGVLRIVAMNWEALNSKRARAFAEQFCASTEWLMMVADESDWIKSPSAARTKNFMKLRGYSRWRRIMSGTPINNAPFDAFTQFGFLDQKILRTTSFYAFKAEYAELLQPGNPLLEHINKQRQQNAPDRKFNPRFGPQVVVKGKDGRPKWKNLDRLSALIQPFSFRVLKKDCLDLPEKVYKTSLFDLTAEQQVHYDKMERECRLLFMNDETPVTKLTALGKLSQITSGYFLHPGVEEPVRIEGANPRLDILAERVAAIVAQGDKVVVWARYRAQIADVVARLKAEGRAVVEYHGGTSDDDRLAAIAAIEEGEAEVFVGNQQAGGTGITIVRPRYVIYFSNSFSMRERAQSEDRSHRIGQRNAVTYLDIAARGTIDEDILAALADKAEVADALLNRWSRL